ncbi:MAG: hypothetical protein AAB460_01615 [Patescibacteria group bacterium]
MTILSKKNKSVDVIVILCLTLVGFGLAWLAQGTLLGRPLLSWGLFIVLPVVVYLSFRKKKPFEYIAMGTFVIGFVFSLVLETLAEFNGAWHVADTVFSYRFPGGASLDAILGYVLMTFLTLVIYEHFLDRPHRGRVKFVPRRLAMALVPSTLVVMTLFVLTEIAPEIISVSYLYAIAGPAAIVFPLIVGFREPTLYSRMVKIMPYFFFIYLVSEYFAVTFSWWTYPSGEYIGYVSLAGVSFPIEELLFWMLFYAASIVVYYEEYIDDDK